MTSSEEDNKDGDKIPRNTSLQEFRRRISSGVPFELRNRGVLKGVTMATLSTVLYLVDVGSDINLALQYKTDGRTTWFIATSLFIVANYILQCAVVLLGSRFYKNSFSPPVWFKVMTLFMLGPVASNYLLIKAHINYHRNPSKYQDSSVFGAELIRAGFQAIESLSESGPQCTLQIYAFLILSQSENIKVAGIAFSILTSFLSVTFNFFSAEKHLHVMIRNRPMPLHGQISLLLWTLFEIAQRILAFALFLSLRRFRVIFVCGVVTHVLIFVVIGVNQLRSDNVCSLKKICGVILDSIMKIFCCTRIKHINLWDMMDQIILFYILFYTENWVLICVWFMYRPVDQDWLHLVVLIIFVSSFIIQTMSQVIYYTKTETREPRKSPSVVQMEDTVASPLCEEKTEGETVQTNRETVQNGRDGGYTKKQTLVKIATPFAAVEFF